MKWKAAVDCYGKPSKYAIESGPWFITKSLCNTAPKFTLWHGNKRIGDFDTAEKAKEAASAGIGSLRV